MFKGKFVFLSAMFLFIFITLSAVTNTWNGNFNSYWHNNANWSQGHIPTSSEDVVIPGSLSRYPIVDFYDENCSSLTLNSGSSLTIRDQKLVVSGDIAVSGAVYLTDTTSGLYCDNITWESGSSASMTGSATIYLTGTWQFSDGAEVFLDAGYVDFSGSSPSYIRSKDDDSYLNNVRDNKTGTYLANSSLSTNTLRIHGNIYIYNNCEFQSYSSHDINLGGFINNMGGEIHLNNGKVVFMQNTVAFSYFEAGDYFNNVEINSSGTVNFNDPIEIKGNLTITSGTLDPNDNTITIGGNWTNNVGDSGFIEGSGRVIFNGSSHQYCSNEIFNILEINKSAAFRLNGTTVTCATYDWTAGAVDVLSGTFTANDLADNGIYGNWYLNAGGTINIHQDSSQYTDLNGNLHIFGGTFNVYGGDGASYWPYSADGSIEMSGGILDFHDVGIYSYNSSSHSFSENITGGTIRTVDYLRIDNPNFTPTGGTIEVYGGNDINISQSAGSLYNLVINKASTRNDNAYITVRDGGRHPANRSNEASLTTDVTVSHDLTIQSGTLNLNGYTLTDNNNMTIYGTLKMNNSSDALIVNRMLNWKSGSSSDITAGNITSNYIYKYDSGTNAALDNSSTLTIGGSISYIINQDVDATIGNLDVNSDLYFNTTSQQVKVLGNMNIATGKSVNANYYNLYVSGTTSIPNGASISVTSGHFTTNGALNLEGDITLGDGDITINNDFDIASTGSLTINGTGTFNESGSYICNIYGNLTMSAGTFNATESLFIKSGATTTITGGEIDCGLFIAQYAGTFQPTGGKVKIMPNGTASINVSNGNYLYDFEVDGPSHGGQLTADLDVHHNLDITNGFIKLNGHNLNVSNDMTIYGTLKMNDAADILTVDHDLIWKSGSSDDITTGNITCNYVFQYENGTNAALDNSSTLTMGGATSNIVNQDADATIGNLVVNSDLYFNTSSQQVKILGDMSITAGKSLNLNSYALNVTGTTAISNTASLTVTTGSFSTDNSLSLDGSLNLINNGTININGNFGINSTGSLTINGGVFTQSSSSGTLDIYGNLTMTAGEFDTNRFINFVGGSTSSISGGEINCYAINAPYSGSLQATGGQISVSPSGIVSIVSHSDNYFYDLEINGATTTSGVQLGSIVNVHHNLDLTQGSLELNGYELNVTNSMNIYGTLKMNNAADALTVNYYLIWKSGSSDNITAGNITCNYAYKYENGTNAALDNSSTLTMGGVTSYIVNQDADATIGNLNVNSNLYFNTSSQQVKVLGDMNVAAGKSVNLNANSLDVAGTTTIPSTSLLDITSGDFTENGTLVLSGDLSLDTGSVTVSSLDLENNSVISLNSNGNFTANDLVDAGILGTWTLQNGSTVNLYQDSSQFIDLSASLHIFGGLFNVYGGSATSWWSYLANTSVEMSSGTIDFHDVGIYIFNSSSYTFSENITGGTIRTTGSLKCDSADFTPSGGTIEMYGGTNASIIESAGSFYNLNINKSTTRNDRTFIRERDGSIHPVDRSSEVLLYSNVTVENDLIINSGTLNLNNHTLTVNQDVDVTDATLKMNNASDILNAGTDNNNLFYWGPMAMADITNGTINNYGNWIFEYGTLADLTGGTVNFVGSTDSKINNYALSNSSFYNLNSNKTGGSMVIFNDNNMSYDLQITNNLTNTSGTFYLKNGGVKVGGNVEINADEINLNAGTNLYIGTALNVNNTGTFNAIATSGNETVVTSNTASGYYDFSVNSGGTISAEYVTFERMGTNGINIKSGAAIDTSYPLNHCVFKDGNGPLLKIDNNQTLTIDDVQFIAGSSKDATYNIEKTVNAGLLTMTNATGSFAGPDFENDPYNIINWSGFLPDLVITDVSYSDTNPYLADLVTVTVVVKNQGNTKLLSSQPFYVDYFNNPATAPAIGDVGDTYTQVSKEIPTNDTIHVNINISNNVAESWNSYIIVDSDEIITELDETNNTAGPYSLTWQALPTVSDLVISKEGNDIKLVWTYPISADSYKIYRTTNPYDYGTATSFTSTIKRYTDTGATSADKYFYVVNAVRNYPPSKAVITKEMKEKRKEFRLRK